MSNLPTRGTFHGHPCRLEPTRRVVHAEFDYVHTYQGLSYNTYAVELILGEWPAAEAAAYVIEHARPWGAKWGAVQDIHPPVRTLTVYTD